MATQVTAVCGKNRPEGPDIKTILDTPTTLGSSEACRGPGVGERLAGALLPADAFGNTSRVTSGCPCTASAQPIELTILGETIVGATTGPTRRMLRAYDEGTAI